MARNLGSIGETNVQIVADDKKLRKGLKSAQRQTEKSSNAMSNSIGKFGKALGALGIAAVGASLVKLGRDAVKAFKVQETAVRGLTTGMKLQGATIREINDALKTASTLQAKTVFGDEETIDAMKKAVATGADYTEVVKSASLAQDIASATGRDLGTIFELLGRGIQGDVTMLQRYVPSIKLLNKEQKTWANIQKILNAQFGGTAAKNAQTYTGQVQQMSNAWGDLQEQAGKAILVITAPAISKMLGIFESLNELLSGSARSLREFDSASEELLVVQKEMAEVLESQATATAKEEAFNRLAKREQELKNVIASQKQAIELNKTLAAQFGTVTAPPSIIDPVTIESVTGSLHKFGEGGRAAFDIIRRGQDEVNKGFEDMNFGVEKWADDLITTAIDVANAMEGAMSNEFFDIMEGNTENLGKSMRRLFLQMASDALAAITKLVILTILKNLITKGAAGIAIAGAQLAAANSLSKAFGFTGGKAKGGAFEGGVEKFANGGIVSRPSLFRQNSGLGVMGEAGPEAIMPLARTHDGDLGVKSTNNTFILEVDGEAFYNAIKAREAFETRSGVLQTA